MAPNGFGGQPDSPRSGPQAPTRRRKKGAARRFTRVKKHKSNTTQRVFPGPGPQRIVKPTSPNSPSSDIDRPHMGTEMKRFFSHPGALETLAEASHTLSQEDEQAHATESSIPSQPQDGHNKRNVTEPPSFTVEVQQQFLQDVEMTDVVDAPVSAEHAFSPLDAKEQVTADQRKDGTWSPSPHDECSLNGARSETGKATATSRRKVRFSETDQIQPYTHINKPKDVRSLPASTRATSDKISWLRNPNMYDSNIRLQVRGSAMNASVFLKVADLKDMEGLWAKVSRLGKLETTPDQVQFGLDEESRPFGYDTKDDEKRFRFGKRANDQYPEFVKRCQEAARAKAEAEMEEEQGGTVDATSEGAGSSNGTGRRSQRLRNSDVFGVVEFIWRR